jgi:hypothetical protein
MHAPHSPGMAWLTIALVLLGLLVLLGTRLWDARFAARRPAAAPSGAPRRLKRANDRR